MRLSLPKTRGRVISLTSLIDVIFLLLLFFMLSTSFSNFTEVQLSQSSQNASGEQSEDERNVIVVEIGAASARINRENIPPQEILTAVESQINGGAQVYILPLEGLDSNALIQNFLQIRALDNVEAFLLTGEKSDE